MKWISVKDRMPEIHEDCIIWIIEDNCAYFANRDRDEWAEGKPYWCAPEHPKGWEDDEISHWMYLDDIPKPDLDICDTTVCIHFKEKILEISFELKDK